MKIISDWIKDEDHNYRKILLYEYGGIVIYYSLFTTKYHAYGYGKWVTLDRVLISLGGLLAPVEAQENVDRIIKLNVFT